MLHKEIEAAEKWHLVEDKIDKLVREFTEFNLEKEGNIHTPEADKYRKDLLKLHEKSSELFKVFVYTE